MKATTFAIVFIATCAISARAAAQNVYRCADGYSQQPCAGGRDLPVQDVRTEAQKKQTSAAAARDARLADSLEKERLKQEAQPAPAYVPPPPYTPTTDAKPQAAPKLHKPQVFTAVAPGDKASKPKKANKKKAAKPAAAR